MTTRRPLALCVAPAIPRCLLVLEQWAKANVSSQVREGFIIEDDEDDEPEDREQRRRERKKRRRAEREEEEAVLDEEDLDLIGEANPEWERKTTSQVRPWHNSNM